MKIRYKIWLESDGEAIFCRGREQLLRNIDELHSLHAAAKKMKMSYRAAWGRLRASEKRLGVKLTCSDGPHKGMHLTKEAKTLLKKFDTLQHNTVSFFNGCSRDFSIGKTKGRQKKKSSVRVKDPQQPKLRKTKT